MELLDEHHILPTVCSDSILDTGCSMKSINIALENDFILNRIFGFLDHNDSKLCRCVCRKWKNVIEPTFKKRVRLCFSFGSKICKKRKSTVKYPAQEDLLEFFRNSQQEYPFIALKLCNTSPWSPETLTKLFSTEGRFITDLTFMNVRLPFDGNEEDQKLHQSCDLKNLLNGIVNLQTLKIGTTPLDPERAILEINLQGVTRFTVSLDFLTNIANINLGSCILELSQGITIAPINLRLENMEFTRDNKTVDDAILNDFVDFSFMKQLSLNSYDRKNITLDLKDTVKMEKLCLHNELNVLNFEESLWEVDLLYLNCFPFKTPTNMKIVNLYISNCNITTNLIYLPQSCVNLSLSSALEISKIDLLPNVKCLELRYCYTIASFFPHLIKTFNNLVKLKLFSPRFKFKKHNSPEFPADIDTDLIPQSVKVLELVDDYFEFVGDEIRKLDILILEQSTVEFACEVINHFAPSILIVYVKDLKPGRGQSLIRKLSNKSEHRIVLGLFDWKNPCHQVKNPVRHYCFNSNDGVMLPTVGISGEFYSFFNRKGNVFNAQSYNEVRKTFSNLRK